MTRILVIQLCRLGDILQTTPMLRGLRRMYPGAAITLVLHDMMAGAPVPPALYDRLIPFPYSRVGAGASEMPDDWAAHARLVTNFLEDVGREPFDLTVNLSHNDLSGFLSLLIPSREVRGGVIDRDRRRLVQGPWMTYFWSSQMSRMQGCFNLVDLHNWTAGVPSDPTGLEIAIPAAARASMAAWLEAHGLADRPLIAVQLGASDERKRWRPEQFAAAVNCLPAALGEVVFVGVASERGLLAHARPLFTRPVHEAVGTTSLGELAALLERCRLLITNDTGTMHVAAAAGTKIVAISTGPVFVHETGPYGTGHFVIEPRIDCFPCALGSDCKHIGCRERITPADVAALAAHALEAGPLPTPAGARILTGRFLANGRIDYRPVWPVELERTEVWRQAAARVWEVTLGAPGGDGHGATAAAPPASGRRLPNGSPEASETVALRALADVAQTAAALARRVPWSNQEERQGLSTEIARHLRILQRAGQTEAVCQPIVAYLTVRLDTISEQDVVAVARIYADECAAAAARAELLADALVARYREAAWTSVRAAS